jgi:acyl-CoA thioesterase-1
MAQFLIRDRLSPLVGLFALMILILGETPLMAKSLQLVAFGDSLTAGYLLPADKAFPVVLERELRAKGYDVTIINGGVSGDTTSAGLERLDWTVPDGTDGVIVELGANDALRGIDPSVPRAAIAEIVARLEARKIKVMLAGMMAPRNLGSAYGEAFDSIYPSLAKDKGLILYPFFIDGLVGNPQLLQQDGLHPTAQGVEEIVRRILPTVERFIASLKS